MKAQRLCCARAIWRGRRRRRSASAGVWSRPARAVTRPWYFKYHNTYLLIASRGYLRMDLDNKMINCRHAQRVSGSDKYSATADVVDKATLHGIMKRKREVIVPWYYKIPIKIYENFPGLVEMVVRRNLRSTKQLLAEKEAASK